MNKIILALFCGGLFGFGLALSEMINPARVIGFLDIFGAWDATLIFVMGGALIVTLITTPLILAREKPVFETGFNLPGKTVVDGQLIAGAVLFGIGWGLSGLCPGPAVAALVTLSGDVILFVAFMLIGSWVAGYFLKQSLS